MQDFVFPQFRKLVNDKSFYRIDDLRHFTEKQIIGHQRILFTFEAIQYPEILRIQDMLQCTEGFALSSQEEFEKK